MNGMSSWVIDVLVVLIIVVSAAYATWRGFVSETLAVFSWAAAAFASLYMGPWVTPLFAGLISSPTLALVAGYGAVFLAVVIPLSFVSYRFSQEVKHSPVGTLDRSLGLAFGVVRGLVIIGFAYFVFSSFVPVSVQPKWMTEARLLPLIQESSWVLLSLVPSRDKADKHDAALHTAPHPAPVAQKPHKKPVAKAAPKKKDHKTYGADDRRGLDRLIEATGSGKKDKP
jgi:membrane protein required for colicin V production